MNVIDTKETSKTLMNENFKKLIQVLIGTLFSLWITMIPIYQLITSTII